MSAESVGEAGHEGDSANDETIWRYLFPRIRIDGQIQLSN
jgi:hypothetical protein